MVRTKRHNITSIFAVAIVGLWLVSLLVRMFYPDLVTQFTGLDAAVLLVLSYWFSSRSVHDGRPRP